MTHHDPRVDAYIARSAEFARPILEHLRAVVHAACPEVEETMKWSAPHFMHHGMLCGMAAFKQHCAFGFWKGALIVPEAKDAAMGQFGCLRGVADLPSKKRLMAYIRQAMKLNEEGVAQPRAAAGRQPKPPPLPPDDLLAALGKNRKAKSSFEAFSPSHQREYIEWITEAKREDTRQRRLLQAVEWLAEGKSRNWKYEKC